MRRLILLILALCLLVPTAAFGSAADVIEDCNDDDGLSRTYTQAEYKKALQDLPSDVDEYSDCRQEIRRARLRAASRSSDSGAREERAERKIPKSKRDRIARELQSKKLAAAAPLEIGGTVVDPDSLESSSKIPVPLVVVLMLVALAAIAGASFAVYRFVNGRRNN